MSSFNRVEPYRYALCMELQNDKFRYTVIDIETKKSVEEKSFTLLSFNKAEISKILEDSLFKLDFKSFSLTFSSNRHTLVPNAIFNGNPKEIFELNHQAPYENLDYNRIPELGIVSIYEVPIWIKSIFVIKMPRIKIIHTSTTLLKGIFNLPVFNGKIHVFWQENSFYLVLTAKGKLEYFNLFQTIEVSDFVYHLLFVLEQKELNLKDFKLHLYGLDSKDDRVAEIKDLLDQEVEANVLKEKGRDFILINQLLCV